MLRRTLKLVYYQAILLLCKHALRATYVLKLLFSVSSVKCSILGDYTMYGWISGDGEGCIEIDWDDVSDCQ